MKHGNPRHGPDCTDGSGQPTTPKRSPPEYRRYANDENTDQEGRGDGSGSCRSGGPCPYFAASDRFGAPGVDKARSIYRIGRSIPVRGVVPFLLTLALSSCVSSPKAQSASFMDAGKKFLQREGHAACDLCISERRSRREILKSTINSAPRSWLPQISEMA
jgi:hypothetical protein